MNFEWDSCEAEANLRKQGGEQVPEVVRSK
jgi:uncharacterized DUF497 family protein